MPALQPARIAPAVTAALTPSRAPTTYDGPPEQVLSDFMFAQYAALEAQGGLPMTVTASGKSGLNLETAVGRMRVCDLWACQQGATTTQASPCEEAQRRWEAQKLYNRIRSALTQLVSV